MKKYLAIFKSHLASFLEYRGAMFSYIIVEILNVASGIFIWFAIYRDHDRVGDYDLQKLVTYFLLLPLIGGFTYVFVSSSLPHQIKDGRISVRLLKPYSIPFSEFIRQVGLKIINFGTKVPMYFGLLFVAAVFFGFKPNIANIVMALGVVLIAFVLNFLLDLCLSYFAFWVDDVWSFKHLKLVGQLIFGGLMFPLDLLPNNLKTIFNILPLKFLYYVPIAALQGTFSQQELIGQTGQMFLWIGALFLFSKVLWRLGLKKYEAYGN